MEGFFDLAIAAGFLLIPAIAQLQAACGVEGQAENTLNKVLAKVKKCQSESTQN